MSKNLGQVACPKLVGYPTVMCMYPRLDAQVLFVPEGSTIAGEIKRGG
jgi:hypothetical protein